MERCRSCASPAADRELIPLWDGELYCRTCLEEVCPGLADYALAHEVLEETTPAGNLRVFDFCIVGAKAGLAFALIFPVSGLVLGAPFDRVFQVTVGGLVCTGMLMPIATALIYLGSRLSLPRTIRIAAGELSVQYPNGTYKVSLDKCEFWVGATGADTCTLSLPMQPAILLTLSTANVNLSIACGLSPEMLERWLAFLKLAEIRIRPNVKVLLRWLILWTGLGVVLGCLAGKVAGAMIGALLENPAWEPGLRLLLAMDGALMGLLGTSVRQMSGPVPGLRETTLVGAGVSVILLAPLAALLGWWWILGCVGNTCLWWFCSWLARRTISAHNVDNASRT